MTSILSSSEDATSSEICDREVNVRTLNVEKIVDNQVLHLSRCWFGPVTDFSSTAAWSDPAAERNPWLLT